jgi:hypothetical protein
VPLEIGVVLLDEERDDGEGRQVGEHDHDAAVAGRHVLDGRVFTHREVSSDAGWTATRSVYKLGSAIQTKDAAGAAGSAAGSA